MHPDKKTEELEQITMLEQEKKLDEQEAQFETTDVENEKVAEEKPKEVEFETEMDRAKKKRREVIFEFALFFVLGFLLGVTIKTEAVKRITIGYNDYQITKPLQSYNVADLKKALDEKIAQQSASQNVQPQQ